MVTPRLCASQQSGRSSSRSFTLSTSTPHLSGPGCRATPSLRHSRSSQGLGNFAATPGANWASGARLPSLEQKPVGKTGAARRYLRKQSEPALPDDLWMDTPGPGTHAVVPRGSREPRAPSFSFGRGESRF